MNEIYQLRDLVDSPTFMEKHSPHQIRGLRNQTRSEVTRLLGEYGRMQDQLNDMQGRLNSCTCPGGACARCSQMRTELPQIDIAQSDVLDQQIALQYVLNLLEQSAAQVGSSWRPWGRTSRSRSQSSRGSNASWNRDYARSRFGVRGSLLGRSSRRLSGGSQRSHRSGGSSGSNRSHSSYRSRSPFGSRGSSGSRSSRTSR